MQKIISTYIILQLFYFNPRVESLKGPNGVPVHYGEFPYVASLQHHPGGENFCTGTLITKKHILTVAHCIIDKTITEVRIVFEVASLSETTWTYALNSWVTYDKWADGRSIIKEPFPHDIAVLELIEKVFQPGVQPIRLSVLSDKKMRSKNALITGWQNHELQKAFVYIMRNKDCGKHIRLIINKFIEIDSGLLCTAALPHVLLENGVDSGAPIVGDNATLLGVNVGPAPDLEHAYLNFTDEFLHYHQVNLHASVDYYRKFIISTTGYQ